jgi:hypothetical protein
MASDTAGPITQLLLRWTDRKRADVGLASDMRR